MLSSQQKPPPPPAVPESERRVFINHPEWDKIAVYLIGTQQRFRDNIIIPRMMGPVYIKSNDEKLVERVMESCGFKSLMSCVIGKINFIIPNNHQLDVVYLFNYVVWKKCKLLIIMFCFCRIWTWCSNRFIYVKCTTKHSNSRERTNSQRNISGNESFDAELCQKLCNGWNGILSNRVCD